MFCHEKLREGVFETSALNDNVYVTIVLSQCHEKLRVTLRLHLKCYACFFSV